MTDLGALSYRKTDLDPLEILESDLDAFRPRFAAAGIDLHLDDRLPRRGGFLPWQSNPADLDGIPAPPDDPGRLSDHLASQFSNHHLRLHGDGQRLSQLFRNLLRNSLQYTDAGGELRIGLSLASRRTASGAAPPLPSRPPPGGKEQDRTASRQVIPALNPPSPPSAPPPGGREWGWLVIDFQDSAPGVPAEALPHLFERLYRVDASRARHTGGAGLGLTIARNIATAHGGDIAAHSSPLGGLWLRLRLPLEGNAP
jgi:two-component system sensor histidine kinase BaeS